MKSHYLCVVCLMEVQEDLEDSSKVVKVSAESAVSESRPLVVRSVVISQ